MFEIEIKIIVKEGFGEFHKESILKDLKETEELEGIKSKITVETDYHHSAEDQVRVLLCGEAVPEKALKEFVDWTCQYHEGTMTHNKNYKGVN